MMKIINWKIKNLAILLACLFTVAGCSGSDVKESLGLKKYAPDEFMVVSRPALTIPPSYTLVKPGEKKVYGKSIKVNEAKTILLGNANNYRSYISNSEKSLLKNAKTSKNNRDIRKIIDEEYSEYLADKKENKESFLSSLNPFNNDNEQILDAKKERERILKNEREGKSILKGKSESVKKDTSIF